MRCWAEDREPHALSSTLLARGAAAVRERHVGLFEEPHLRGAVDVICTDGIRDGRITRMWLRTGEPRLDP